MMNPQSHELPISRRNFHSLKGVPAIEIVPALRLACIFHSQTTDFFFVFLFFCQTYHLATF